MTGRRRLGLVAATATLLASAPLSSIFETYSWLMRCILTVGLIAGAVLIARTLRFPVWAQAASMAGVLLLVLTWMFPSGKELLSLLPSTHTFQHFGNLFMQAASDTRNYGVPVPDREGLLFITVLGIGAVAIAVDLVTVVLRRPALAGLPMLAIYSVPVAIYVDDVPVWPFIIGSLGFLWLLVSDNVDRVRRFGRRFTGDGRDVDVWEPSPLAAAGRRLAVVGVAAAVILPLAVPGITTGLLSQLTQSGQGAAGLGGGGGGRINLYASLSGQLTQSDTKEMLKVATNDPSPFYLRIGVADQVSEQGVGSRSNSGRSIRTDPFPDPRGDAATNQAAYQQYRAIVEITGLDQTLAPIYSSTVGISGIGGSWNYDQPAQALFSTRNTTKGRKYTIDYQRASYTPAQLRTADQLDPTNPIVVQNTAVPKDAVVNNKVQQLTAGKTDQYDKVRAIYDFFSRTNGFSYSLQTESGTSGSDIDVFLKNKTGYCQQYSAAMTWMVRAAGYPARVAFGFTRGISTDGGRTYSITNRNAHAWTEVYFAGFGWVPFDPTPASALTGPSRPAWAPDPDAPPSTAVTSPGGVATGANPSASASGRQGPVRDYNDPSLAGPAAAPVNNTSTVLLIVGIVALLVALLLTPAVRRTILRRHRHRVTAPRAPTVVTPEPEPWGTRDFVVTPDAVHARADAHAAWDELIDTMIDFRVLVDPAETPRHTARRLATQTDLAERAASSAVLLGTAEEKARYARQPILGGVELTSALDEIRRGLAENATWRTRLAAVIFPPSVLLRWRLAAADTSAGWVATLGRVRETLSRWSPRRLLPRPRQ